MNTTTTGTVGRQRRKTALIISLAAVVVVALVWLAFSFFNGRSQAAQSTADDEASGYADTNLLEILNEVTATGGSGVSALEDALRAEEEAGTSSNSTFSIIAGETSGPSVPAVVYYRAEDKSFSGGFSGSPDFGIACRVYSVDDGGITVQQVDCPSDTPEHPFHDYRPALDAEGGLRFPDEMNICEYDSGELQC